MEIRQATILPDKVYALLAVRSGVCRRLPAFAKAYYEIGYQRGRNSGIYCPIRCLYDLGKGLGRGFFRGVFSVQIFLSGLVFPDLVTAGAAPHSLLV